MTLNDWRHLASSSKKEYEQYVKAEMDARDAKRRKFDTVEVETMKTGDPKRVQTSCEEDSQNNKRLKGDKSGARGCLEVRAQNTLKSRR